MVHIIVVVWKRWLKIGRKIGNFQAQVIFSVFYLVFLSVIGTLMKIADPLRMGTNKKIKTAFSKWDYPSETLQTAHRQY